MCARICAQRSIYSCPTGWDVSARSCLFGCLFFLSVCMEMQVGAHFCSNFGMSLHVKPYRHQILCEETSWSVGQFRGGVNVSTHMYKFSSARMFACMDVCLGLCACVFWWESSSAPVEGLEINQLRPTT